MGVIQPGPGSIYLAQIRRHSILSASRRISGIISANIYAKQAADQCLWAKIWLAATTAGVIIRPNGVCLFLPMLNFASKSYHSGATESDNTAAEAGRAEDLIMEVVGLSECLAPKGRKSRAQTRLTVFNPATPRRSLPAQYTSGNTPTFLCLTPRTIRLQYQRS